MKLSKEVVGSVVLSVCVLGLSACRGKSESSSAGDTPTATASGGMKDEEGRELNAEEIQKQIQAQTEQSIQMANQQQQMLRQQTQMQMTQQQALQNAQQAQRQAQQAAHSAEQARRASQNR
jgi:hypothetical protein